MPIYKYKSFEDAEKALWNFTPDDDYYRIVDELWEFANELNSISYPKGVFKFKNFKEANEHRNTIELTHAKKLRVSKNNNKILS